MLNIQEIRKNPDGLLFDLTFDLAEELQKRNPEILNVKEISASGKARYEDGLYFLDYNLSYKITLTSSRSLEPVTLNESYPVNEIFIREGEKNKQNWVDDEWLLTIKTDELDIEDSVADNILLNIPLKILTDEEELGQDFPTGNDWMVLSEEEYQLMQQLKKEETSPFAALQGLFDSEK